MRKLKLLQQSTCHVVTIKVKTLNRQFFLLFTFVYLLCTLCICIYVFLTTLNSANLCGSCIVFFHRVYKYTFGVEFHTELFCSFFSIYFYLYAISRIQFCKKLYRDVLNLVVIWYFTILMFWLLIVFIFCCGFGILRGNLWNF